MMIVSHIIKFGPNLDRWKYCDVRLTTEDSNSSIPVHRNILAQVSLVFTDLFDRNPDAFFALNVKNVNFEILEKIIELIYQARVTINDKNMERNIMTAIRKLQIRLKINTATDTNFKSQNKAGDNGHYPVITEEIEDLITKQKPCLSIPTSHSHLKGNDKLEDTSLLPEDDRDQSFGKLKYQINYESSNQTLSSGEKTPLQGNQEKVSIVSLPLPVPASLLLLFEGDDNYKEGRVRSAPSSAEVKRSKCIKIRRDIFKELGADDLNENLDESRIEDRISNDVENKILKIGGVKKNISSEDIIMYLDSFSYSVESLVQSISVSSGRGHVKFKSAASTDYFDKHKFELKGAIISLVRPGKKPWETFWVKQFEYLNQ